MSWHVLLRWVCGAGLSAALVAGSWAQSCAIAGRDGPAPALSGTINTYFPPASAGSIGAGTASLGLGTSTGAASTLAPGDLVLVIQMQCETLNTTNTNNYGAGDGTGRGYTDSTACAAGRYEYVRAGPSTTSTSLDLSLSPLTNTYVQDAGTATNRRTYQVIRVPQYSSATLGATVTAPYWDGSSGGIVVMDVAGTLSFGGQTIDVSGRGFRGGGGAVWNGTTATGPDYVITTNITNNVHAMKGEGIGGTPRLVLNQQSVAVVDNGAAWGGYPGGDQGRGAPGNAGGGGDNLNGGRDNGGGGGGGNGGIGGFGAYGWSSAGWPAGTTNDLRGIGGAAFTQRASSRLVMGGGGGAGANNNSAAVTSSGGAGGGLVLIRAGAITGSGTINTNGSVGQTQTGNDSGGGGGAAGSVVVVSQAGSVGTLTVNANGGAGGNGFSGGGTAHAGGGGGAGGVVFTSGSATVSTAGGANGVTNVGDCPTTGVAPCSNANGATPGAPGFSSSGATSIAGVGVSSGGQCLPNLTVTKTTATPSIAAATSATATYTITVSNAASAGGAQNVEVIDRQLPPNWTLTGTPTYVYSPAPPPSASNFASGAESTVNGSAYALRANGAAPGTFPASASNANLNWNTFFIAPGGSVAITYSVSIPNPPTSGSEVGLYHNDAGISYLDPTRSTVGRKISPSANSAANRAGVAYNINTAYESGQFGGQPVGGSNYSGLEAGSTAENVLLQPDLSVTKTRSGSGTLQVGGTDTYSLVARNNGRAIANLTYATNQASAATNGGAGTILSSGTIVLTDTVPAGLTIGTVTPPANWACSVASQLVTCTYTPPSLPIAATTDIPGVIAIPVTVTNAACPGPLNNAANVGSTTSVYAESSTANNVSATVSTTLGCIANVSITKDNARTTTVSGNTTTYSITVSNAGPAAANGTRVSDTPSAGLSSCSVTSCTASGGAVCPASGIWPDLLTVSGVLVATLPAPGSVTFGLICTANAGGE